MFYQLSLRKNNSNGFTLLETIIYLALFAIIIGGGMTAAYQIIQSFVAQNNHIILQEEANFLLRKITWAQTGAITASVSNDGKILTITKNINNILTTLTFASTNSAITLQYSEAKANALNSSNVSISNLTFTKISDGNKSPAVTTNFTLTTLQDGKPSSENFSLIRYLEFAI